MARINSEIIKELKDIADKTSGARNQEEYEKYYDLFFERLDELEEALEGEYPAEGFGVSADEQALYDILVSWNTVWFFAYRLNRNRLEDFKNLWRFAKDIYLNKGGRERTDFEKLKADYYGNLDDVRNPYHIIPIGPDTSIWQAQ